MAVYRRVYDSRHLQADCQNRDQLWNPTLGNRVWATFFSRHHCPMEVGAYGEAILTVDPCVGGRSDVVAQSEVEAGVPMNRNNHQHQQHGSDHTALTGAAPW